MADANLGWNPDWLLNDAGLEAFDAGGMPLLSSTAQARTPGPVRWSPSLPLPKVDDQTPDSAVKWSPAHRKRLAGEILLMSLWRRAALRADIPDSVIPVQPLNGQARGAFFKNALVTYLTARLPGWEFPSERPLREIYGLHLRRDVGTRKSDVLAVDNGDPFPRLMAVISSKWSWRSDRGTEAAQMVPLTRYRPDVPYVVCTAEFVRARGLVRESVEDRVYHLCPDWVAAWLLLYAEWGRDPDWPLRSLDSILAEARLLQEALYLSTLAELADELATAGRYR